ncbi:MAG: hypothetical protein KIT14_13855 [bacterium]|nr:hypothetical protein [bacterium]
MRRLIERGGLLVIGLMVGLAALELVLQGAAVLIRPAPSASGVGARRLLAVGDSNVFGLFLPREASYPHQLGARLSNATVVNWGVPGTTSGRLRSLLPALLAEQRPTDVLVTVGVNDFWAAGDDRIERPWWARLRTVRLGYLLAWYLRDDQPETVDPDRPQTFLVGDAIVDARPRRRRVEDGAPETVANLVAIAEAVRAAGATPWFVTYGSETPVYRVASRRLREAAEQTGARLVAVTVPPEEQFHDGHPRADGYARIAAAVAAAVERDHASAPVDAASSSASRKQ